MPKYVIEPVKKEHDSAICQVIKQVGAEFGAVGEGFGPSDAEVKAMSRHYGNTETSYSRQTSSSQYWVATLNRKVVGGAGIAPFNGRNDCCELRKLFLLPETRGQGIGKALVDECLQFARNVGFTQCYLDTMSSMKAAISMYEKYGFERLNSPLAGTPHGSCNVWMLLQL